MDKNYAYFVIKGTGDTAELTSSLGIEPSSAWNRGDKRKNGSTYDFSLWSYESEQFVRPTLDQSLIAVIDFIDSRAIDLHNLPGDFAAHLQCVGYHEEQSPGFHFDARTIRRLGELGLAVDFDLYCHAGE